MRYSFSSGFTRLAWAFLIAVVLLTIAGRGLTVTVPESTCSDWPLCVLSGPFAWYRTIHFILAGVAAVLVLGLFVRAWQAYRDDRILLPLTTITTILFFGQAFVGAMQMLQGFPL